LVLGSSANACRRYERNASSHRCDDVVSIPGTKRRPYLEENVSAVDVDLTDEDLARLDAIRSSGNRTRDMGWVNRDTPALDVTR
jgi:diketogulonate reductase-like aldo/keto reductase